MGDLTTQQRGLILLSFICAIRFYPELLGRVEAIVSDLYGQAGLLHFRDKMKEVPDTPVLPVPRDIPRVIRKSS